MPEKRVDVSADITANIIGRTEDGRNITVRHFTVPANTKLTCVVTTIEGKGKMQPVISVTYMLKDTAPQPAPTGPRPAGQLN